jgi:hypothetical protein
MPRLAAALALMALTACGPPPQHSPSKPPASVPVARVRPCFKLHVGNELRPKDAQALLASLVENIHLGPEEEALRHPKSLRDIKAMLRKDLVYFYANGASYAKTLDTLEGRFAEAELELLLGDAMLVASQVLTNQHAWVGGHLRVARANLAGESHDASSDRGRTLAQLIRAVEEGNAISDALGTVAPIHVARGAELVRALQKEAPSDVRTVTLLAEYHRMRGEWTEFDAAIRVAESAERAPSLCYLKSMALLERDRKPPAAVKALRECLIQRPKFVRAQAALVLVASRPEGLARELARLKTMDEEHYLVMLLEPTLAANEELLRLSEGSAPRAATPGEH